MDTWRDRLRRRLLEMKAEDGPDRAAIAEQAGISVQAISNYLQGIREPRSLADWERLAAALQVPTAWLVFGAGAPDAESEQLSRRILQLPPESRRALSVLLDRTG